MDFYALVKQKILAHDFNPICIEATTRKNQLRAYEKTPKRIESHRKWVESPAGIASQRKRSKKYIDTHKDDPVWRERKRRNALNWYNRHKDDPEFMARRREKARANHKKKKEKENGTNPTR